VPFGYFFDAKKGAIWVPFWSEERAILTLLSNDERRHLSTFLKRRRSPFWCFSQPNKSAILTVEAHFGSFLRRRKAPLGPFYEAKKGAVWHSSRPKNGATFGHFSDATKDGMLELLTCEESVLWHFSQAKKRAIWALFWGDKRHH
jgi:hypothetical protein